MAEKYTYDYVKQFFEDNGCELLEEEHRNVDTPMTYRCECGNVSRVPFTKFRKGQRCMNCKGTPKYNIEFVRDQFKQRGYTLLETEYKNNNTPMRYLCSQGHERTIRLSDLMAGKQCSICVKKYKYTLDDARRIFADKGATLLSTEYIGVKHHLEYVCRCGNTDSITLQDFMRGHECSECHRRKMLGKNNPNWNPSKTEEERQVKREYEEYYAWRRNVYNRDNYTCQCCGKQGGRLNAHHMQNYASHPELRTDIDNGITLCRDCHKDFHRQYGVKHNNRQQLAAFLSVKFREQKRVLEHPEGKEVS